VKPEPTLDSVAAALRAHGLLLRGAFHPEVQVAGPALPDGRRAGTIALAGNAGPEMWARFASERRDEPEPLDAWSARALRAVADAFCAALVLPQDGPPFAPFSRWARSAEPVHASPIGIVIHPEYGLWHAYRGALLFAERLALPLPVLRPRPCDSCDTRPCLSACPVSAFTATLEGLADGYDSDACAAHVASPAGAECRERGCLARRACPAGRAYTYPEPQQRFHMRAFLHVKKGAGVD
jgi:hypothetical protein